QQGVEDHQTPDDRDRERRWDHPVRRVARLGGYVNDPYERHDRADEGNDEGFEGLVVLVDGREAAGERKSVRRHQSERATDDLACAVVSLDMPSGGNRRTAPVGPNPLLALLSLSLAFSGNTGSLRRSSLSPR